MYEIDTFKSVIQFLNSIFVDTLENKGPIPE